MIDLTVNVRDVLSAFDALSAQVPFAASKGLNDLTKNSVQAAERSQLHKAFHIKRVDWAERSVKIVHFAKKTELFTQIGIHPPGSSGEQRTDILAKFETDTEKHPRGRMIAIPTAFGVKRGNTGVISNRDRPKAYRFRQEGNRIVGDRGTFIVKRADGTGLILQRVGKGKASQVFALYLLRPVARIQPDLHFATVASAAVEKDWQGYMLAAFDEAIRTAR